MTEECTHDCASCSADCSSRDPKSLILSLNAHSSVKHVIGVVSGKGGVGKSLVTSSLAVMFNRKGFKTAILDADITGPSIPRAFGINGKLLASEMGLEPAKSETGIEIISANLILDNETDPIVWRGPMIAGAVKQFWNEAHWDNIDYMFVDMPPGTGDVPLTVFQSLPLDGIVIVTSPQELVSMIVEKAVKMAKMMDISIFGVIENMSYIECPDCGKRLYPFGESKLEEVSKNQGVDILARFPIDSEFAAVSDNGKIETVINEAAAEAADIIENKINSNK